MVMAQSFFNLNFEEAGLPIIPSDEFGGIVPIADGIPGWQGRLGSTPINLVLHNSFNAGGANISIIGPNWQTVIEGQHSVYLQAGALNGEYVSATLFQAGRIPDGTRSLLFSAWGSQISAAFAGHTLPLFEIGGTGDDRVYGADITEFAGAHGMARVFVAGKSSRLQ